MIETNTNNNIISKEKFVSIMDNFLSMRQTAQKMNDTLKADKTLSSMSDWFSATCLLGPEENTVVELLAVMFNDTTDLISYWMYEQDFGLDWKDETMTDADGNNIDLSTAEKLYDYLIEDM